MEFKNKFFIEKCVVPEPDKLKIRKFNLSGTADPRGNSFGKSCRNLKKNLLKIFRKNSVLFSHRVDLSIKNLFLNSINAFILTGVYLALLDLFFEQVHDYTNTQRQFILTIVLFKLTRYDGFRSICLPNSYWGVFNFRVR